MLEFVDRQRVMRRSMRETTLEYISVDKDGIPTSGRNLKMTTYKIRWNSILRQDSNGNYRYVSEKQAEILQSVPLPSEEGVGRYAFAPAEYGRYRIEVRDLDSGASASTEFYTAGWGYTPWLWKTRTDLRLTWTKRVINPVKSRRRRLKPICRQTHPDSRAGKRIELPNSDNAGEHRGH